MIQSMSNQTFVLIILGTMLVTYIPRMLPLVILTKYKLSKKVEQFLYYIPVAILGSILATSVVFTDEKLNISFNNEYLIASLLTIAVAKFTKRVDIIVVSGIIFTVIIRVLN